MARKIPKTISETDFLNVLMNIKRKDLKAAFILGFYQCMRISEVINLKKEDIDYKQNTIHIKQGKGGKDRIIPLMKPAVMAIKHIPLNIGIRALQIQTKKLFPGLNFHTFRHSGASYYLNEKGIDIRYIQQLLGHSRLDTTQIYTHINPKQLIDKFSGLWNE